MTTGLDTATRNTNSSKLHDLPHVSVVVPVHNGRHIIAACIESLLAQHYPSSRREIIVVDNNSDDGTPDIVYDYPVRLAYERDVQTSYAARNTGLRLVEGDIVAFTDADCLADPNWLDALVQPFSEPSVAGVLGRVASHEPTSLLEEFATQADPLGKERLGGLLSMITANVAYRRSVLMQVGGFRSELFTGGDVDLGWRVQQLPDWQVQFAPGALVYHKHRTTLAGLHRQYYRYGYSEIILDTLYRNQRWYPRRPRRQLLVMLRQVRALLIYILSFAYRLGRSALLGWDSKYVLWPALWFAVESSVLLGKLRGLISTRFLTRQP